MVRVIICAALLVPASMLPNETLAGENDTLAVAEPDPMPVRARGCVAGTASVDTLSDPGIEADSVGAKVTSMLQLCPAISDDGQSLV